ncbi:MAG TPA: DUF2141 domain-containing protein [Cytophagaceae bacterium]|jgi:uncharacterized protein (DUF2141 family)|nr:DUF2141 domain-containing protein [Cytophagaceae bacterium]
MKQYICAIILLLVVALRSFSQINAQGSTSKVTVSVYNSKSNSGKIILTFYNSKEDFPTRPEKALRKIAAPVINNSATFVLESVPYGTYAISVFHDENNNNDMDRNFIGIPKEGVGASMDAKGSMGPPKFEDAKFLVKEPYTNLKIKLDYIF